MGGVAANKSSFLLALICGSIAFFISTFLITSGMLIYLGTDIIISHVMIISVLLCLVEAVHTFGLDNFTLPVVSSIVFNFIHNM